MSDTQTPSQRTGTETNTTETSSDVNADNHEVIVVMDGYGDDWTPSAVMTDEDEATKLRDMLAKDAPAVCSTAPWYTSKENVRNREPTRVPDDLPGEVSVCFYQDTALAASEGDLPAREMQFEENGLRGTVTVYETAKSVAADKPSVMGRFIEASNTTAEDILDSIE